ncbi:MAG: SIS domain-containing protein [Chloroflexi bacterium]|nr:SIS domain-containing protein [Chloroflexota bacterium]
MKYAEYLDEVCKFINQMKETQGEAIRKAAALVGETIISGGLVYTFGSGHSQLLSQEVHARAGGLYPVVQILDPMWGRAERLEGFADVLLKGLPLKAGETIFVISNSGRNPEPIEVAMRAKEMGLHVIVVTSLAHSKSVASRHSSGKKLYELGDVVLDTGTPPGDACLSFAGLPVKAGAVSTVLGAALMNAVMVEAIQYILDKGETPPVLMSANLDGSDEYNARVMARYQTRIGSVFGLHA